VNDTPVRVNDPFTPTARTILGTEDSASYDGWAFTVIRSDDDPQEIAAVLFLGTVDDRTVQAAYALWLDKHPDVERHFTVPASRHAHALFTRPHGEECDNCGEEHPWVVGWDDVTAATPGAVPVTILEP
jgi:hypothetical protein